MAGSWLALGPTETGSVSHVIPLNDGVEHDDADDCECVCGPTLEYVEPDAWMYKHHSLDGREAGER